MRYISTRGHTDALTFDEALLAGLAPDGGLYVPETLPEFSSRDISAMAGLSYTQLAHRILQPFMQDVFDDATLHRMIDAAYANFRHDAIAPLVQIGHQQHVLELFHGPTLAFKDFALQLVGQMMQQVLKQKPGKPAIVLGATSGDTGSAAIAGLQGKENINIVILYPKGRPSDVQRRQMTTITDKNVHPLAVDGTFDDCQDMVKTLFSDRDFRAQHRLLAVNSINIARILAQTIYYFYAACSLGAPAKRVSFVVPTGNFGDIYAGYLAKKMGLPIDRLVIATNANDILYRCVQTGKYDITSVAQTLSPSMDIQISSNFERLLFDLQNRDAEALKASMQALRGDKSLTLSASVHQDLCRDFDAHRIDDAATMQCMRDSYARSGYLLDPHSAVGVASAQAMQQSGALEGPIVTLATAHAAKFPDAVIDATGITPQLPKTMQHMMGDEERIIPLDAEIAALKTYLENL
jgi:threonine synthase